MKFTLYAHGQPVGWATMTGFDPSMGGASGAFHPNQRYPGIRPTIREFLSYNGTLGSRDDLKLNEAWKKIEALNLQVRDEHGVVLDLPSIHLVDLSEELGEEEGYELNLAGMHWQTFDRYFPGEREAAEAYYERRYQDLREEREGG